MCFEFKSGRKVPEREVAGIPVHGYGIESGPGRVSGLVILRWNANPPGLGPGAWSRAPAGDGTVDAPGLTRDDRSVHHGIEPRAVLGLFIRSSIEDDAVAFRFRWLWVTPQGQPPRLPTPRIKHIPPESERWRRKAKADQISRLRSTNGLQPPAALR